MRKAEIMIGLAGICVFWIFQTSACAQRVYDLAPQYDNYSSWGGDLLGKIVVNPQGQILGTVADVVVGRNGRIMYLILSPAYGLERRERWVPVPWSAARVVLQDGRVVLDLSLAVLRNAPFFKRGFLPDLEGGPWESRIYRYYGLAPYPYEVYPYPEEVYPYYEQRYGHEGREEQEHERRHGEREHEPQFRGEGHEEEHRPENFHGSEHKEEHRSESSRGGEEGRQQEHSESEHRGH